MMKYIRIFSIFFIIILFTGCSNNSKSSEKVITCSLSTVNKNNNYELNATYKIYANNDIVNKVITEEIITSSNDEILNYFQEYLNKTYKESNEKYSGYDYKVTKKNNKVTSSVKIDYNKMDLEKSVSDSKELKAYVNKDNKMTVDGIKNIYTSMGAVCE